MKRKFIIKIIKGSSIAFITSSLANLITFNSLEITNVLVGMIVGLIAYLFLHVE